MNINGIFNPQNRFWSFMEKIVNLCVLSFLWVLFSLPVITAGASTAALFHYTLKLAKDEEGYVAKTFFRAFKKNFLQATILWLLILFAGAFLVLDLYYCQFMTGLGAVRWAVTFGLVSLLIVYFLTIIYVFPLLAFFQTQVKKCIAHSFVMAMGNLYVSVTIVVIYVVSAVASYFIPVLFMVWFTLASYGASHFFRFVFEKYMKNEEEMDEISQ